MRRCFRLAAQLIENDRPVVAEKLRQATPHWMRHTDATPALTRASTEGGAGQSRHASISTISIYLDTDDVKRARQFGAAFMV
ncbi:hypothetical protein OKW48_001617 [Paraburkholderia youngii]